MGFHLFQNLDWLRRSPRAMVAVGLILSLCPKAAVGQITRDFFNTSGATYQDPNQTTPIETTSNRVDVTADLTKSFVAGIEILLDEVIDWDGNGLFNPGDYASFTYRVVNNGNTPNPIRIPQQIRTLNLDSVDRGVITTGSASNQIVIRYDLNNDGVLAFNDSNIGQLNPYIIRYDFDSNGQLITTRDAAIRDQWDPFSTFATDGFNTTGAPETGSEV